jgi:hypothetical protein|tara:strand:+ start:1356 stop:1652 length:297 start_codon:yes stop_codon:yes gene_type:complete
LVLGWIVILQASYSQAERMWFSFTFTTFFLRENHSNRVENLRSDKLAAPFHGHFQNKSRFFSKMSFGMKNALICELGISSGYGIQYASNPTNLNKTDS